MSFTFDRPEAFLLLLVLVPLVWRLWRGRGRLRRTPRRLIALWLRLLVVLCIVTALAGPQTVATSDDLQVIFVVDRSRSIPPRQQQAVEQSLLAVAAQMGPRDQAGLVTFGERAHLEARPMAERVYSGQITTLVGGDGSDIEAGVQLALTTFPDGVGRRIVLVTDGNENRGNLLEAAALAAARGVPIDVVPIRYEFPNEVFVEKVVLPDTVRLGEPYLIKIVVHSTRSGPARLTVYENRRLLTPEPRLVDLEPGKNVYLLKRYLRTEEELEGLRQGFNIYEARVEPLDAGGQPDPLDQPSNNVAIGFTQLKGRPAVLLVDGHETGGDILARELLSQGILVHRVGDDQIPDDITQLQGYDCVILSNVSADRLSPGQMVMLKSSVRDLGVGLIMVGGENAFGAGGWLGTPIEEVLPVDMDIKQEKVIPNGALCIILHTCEFPQGNLWAKDITVKAMEVLSRHDYFGVIYYGAGGTQWAFKGRMIHPRNKAGLASQIRRGVNPGDMPDFDTPLAEAERGLLKVRAALKHMIIISDGDPVAPSAAVIRRIRGQKITISTVGIYPHSGGLQTLQNLSRLSGGKFYRVSDPRKLPRIFIHEAQVVRKAIIVERTVTPVLRELTEPVIGIVEQGTPPVHGYVASTAKDLANVPLVVEKDMPLLAHWRYGLGRTAAWTSDAKNRWDADWARWDRFGPFWGQLVRWCQKSVQDADYQVQATADGSRAHLVVDAISDDGEFENGISVSATVVVPSGEEAMEVELLQTAPGHYEAEVEVGQVGPYIVNLRYEKPAEAEGGEARVTGQVTGFSVPYSPEFRTLSPNEGMLRQVATLTGGHVLTELDQPQALPGTAYTPSNPYSVFNHDLPRTLRPVDRWQIVLVVAALCFLLDVFVRRVLLDYERILSVLGALLPFLRRATRRAQEEAQRLARSMRPEGETVPRRRTPDLQPADPAAAREGARLLEPAGTAGPAADEQASLSEEAASPYTSRLLAAKRRARQDRRRK